LVVNEGEDYELLLDFDVSRSFLVKGNPKKNDIKGFMFKPVIRASNMALTGSLSGLVREDADDEFVIKNARIYVISTEDITDTIASGKSNKQGLYKIIGLPANSYNVSCEKDGYENTAGTESVEILVGEELVKDFILQKADEEEEQD
jgi:hypothetical protein